MNPERDPCGATPSGTLESLGWDGTFASAFKRYPEPYVPGRVTCRHRTVFDVATNDGAASVHASGALHRTGRLPVVGDFVVLLRQPEAAVSTIVDVLPGGASSPAASPAGTGRTSRSRRTSISSSSSRPPAGT